MTPSRLAIRAPRRPRCDNELLRHNTSLANDIELSLAVDENHLINEVVVTRDGAETLDGLDRRNTYAALNAIGAFLAAINEPSTGKDEADA